MGIEDLEISQIIIMEVKTGNSSISQTAMDSYDGLGFRTFSDKYTHRKDTVMNTLSFKRLLAVIMTLVCVFAYIVFEPTSALAEGIRKDNELTENIDTINSIWDNEPNSYSPLTGELTEGRDEAVKRFRRADGSYELVNYSDPVHYKVNGEWAAIDNTLIYDEETGRFVNTASDLVVELAAGISKDSPLYSISYNGETLTMINADLPGITDMESTVTGIPAERERKSDLTDEEHDELLRFPEELSSSVSYFADDGNEVGLEYKLSCKSLSEYITLFEKPEEAPVYTYTFTTTLKPRQEGNAVIFENETGEVVLYFSAPVMRDAKDNECFDFAVELIANEDGSYTYILTPDEAWLMSEETVYPVVIDPDVNVNFKNNVQNSYISSSNPDFAYGSNANTKYSLKVGGSAGYRTLIRLENMETLAPGDVVIYASINLTRFGTSSDQYGKEIDAYRMNGTWNDNTVTWNIYSAINGGDPYDSSRIETFALSSYAETRTIFDITDLYKKWYAGTVSNYGVLLTSGNYACFYSSRNSDNVSAHPYFSVVYVNSTGLESRFSYSSQSVGRAGTGSVNLYSGNLTFTFADGEIVNGTMPISLSHVYNTNDKGTDIGYGNGWRLNYSQEINEVEITDRNSTQTYFELVDGDGTRHYYKKKNNSSSVYINELDKDSELTINTSANEITITDKGDNKLVFEYDTVSSKKHARLIRIEDANGNMTKIAYSGNGIIVNGELNLRISAITERLSASNTDGQSISFTYSNNRLSSITVPNGLNRTYAYSSGNLTSVGSTDVTFCKYSYNNNNLTSARLYYGYNNSHNYNLNYSYDEVGRVESVEEKANTTARNSLTYGYGWNVTTVTDNQGRNTVYQFNNAGQAVSVRDTEGNAVYAAYNSAEQMTTKLSAVSKTQNTVVNLLKDPGFDNGSSAWTIYGTSPVNSCYNAGWRSVPLYSTGCYAEQQAAVTGGETYTLSAYFAGDSGGILRAFYKDNSSSYVLIAESDETETIGTLTDWERGAVRFTVPSGVDTVYVRAAKSSGSNTTYVDSVQLEKGSVPNRFNLITNGDFTNGLSSYSASSDISSNDGIATASGGTHPSYLTDSVLKITGDRADEFYKQTTYVNGKKGDTYSFGCWCASDSVPISFQHDYSNNTDKLCGERSIKISFYYENSLVNEETVHFGADTNDWQFACGSAVAEGVHNKIVITIRFCQSRNTAYFDGLQLYREAFSKGYTYDEDTGNLTGYVSLIDQENAFEYDDDNNLISVTDAMGNETTYTYDSNHNRLTSTTPEGVESANTYDSNGNVTGTQVIGGTDYISSSAAFDAASALASAVTDARGNSVTYAYDSNTRQQTSVTDPLGNTSTYAYGSASAMLRLASLTSPTGTGSATATVSYTYDMYGELTTISRTNTNYSFTYDSWGNVIDTKVGNITLSTNVYDSYGRLSTVQYGSGFETQYVYDDLDRVAEILQRADSTYPLTVQYEFIYDGEGSLYELRNYKIHRSTFFTYDHAGRCISSTEKSFTGSFGNAITYTGTVSGYSYKYDANNNLLELTCVLGSGSWTTNYHYDADNRPIDTVLHNGREIVVTYDSIGRITSKAIKYGNSTILNTVVGYTAGANGSKTALVSSWQNGSDDAYSYTYDANGNITAITKGSMSFTYVYDKANQLIRENLYYGSGSSDNVTYFYEYDSWGNILNRKRYLYTTLPIHGIPLETIKYSYTDTQWGDLLTSFNGSTITYDAMGNPTSYFGNDLSWDGKKLMEVSYDNGIDRPIVYSYAYDENGLRLEKTVSGTTTEYYYNGSVLIGMRIGTTKFLRFSYDAAGSVVAVDYSTDGGSTFTTYYYLRNAQNDIVKLIDSSGTTVVEYIYDSWGKLLSVTGTLANTVGADQPFRYRGYVYDTETQWYYLQSRYYDPNTGRFISADVYLSTGQGVIGHNAFAYCLNNPLILADGSGSRAHGIARDLYYVHAFESKTYIPVGDEYYASEYVKQRLVEAILISKEEENVVRFMLCDCDSFVMGLINSKGEKATSYIIAECILSTYLDAKGSDLFAPIDRLAFEIQTHIDGYYYAQGIEGFQPPAAFLGYYVGDTCIGTIKNIACSYYGLQISHHIYSDYKQFLLDHCRTIEINQYSKVENLYYYHFIKGAK